MPHGSDDIIVTHADCVCNEELALSCRHQAAVPVARRKWTELWCDPQMTDPVAPWTRRRLVEHYAGTKRKEFERAYESLKDDPFEAFDARIRMFLKADKYEGGSSWKAKAPRCIQFRSKRFGLEMGRYIHPIEKDIYDRTKDVSHTPVFAKGRNSTQRAADLKAKASHFANPVYLLLDQSNWDAHVNRTLLAFEHQLYRRKCSSRELSQLLQRQLVNRGATKNGTKYQTNGTRMSGDCNTALGNCVINYALLSTWAREAGITAAFYVDGDDSVLIYDRSQQDAVDALPVAGWFLQWGMESKVEQTQQWEHCEFCQCRPVWDGLGWRMVRNPQRVMVRSEWTVMPYPDAFIPKLIASVGRCEAACNLGIPVLQALAWKLVELGGTHHKTWSKLDAFYKAKDEVWTPDKVERGLREISMESRISFEEAWGITVSEQLDMERAELRFSGLTQHDLDTYHARFAGDNHLDSRSWI